MPAYIIWCTLVILNVLYSAWISQMQRALFLDSHGVGVLLHCRVFFYLIRGNTPALTTGKRGTLGTYLDRGCG